MIFKPRRKHIRHDIFKVMIVWYELFPSLSGFGSPCSARGFWLDCMRRSKKIVDAGGRDCELPSGRFGGVGNWLSCCCYYRAEGSGTSSAGVRSDETSASVTVVPSLFSVLWSSDGPMTACKLCNATAEISSTGAPTTQLIKFSPPYSAGAASTYPNIPPSPVSIFSF